jgi:hypothetical protein
MRDTGLFVSRGMSKLASSSRKRDGRDVRGLVIISLLLAATSPASADLAPLSDEAQATLRSPADEKIEIQLTGSWPRTNEWRLDTLFAALDGLGGGYVGVGADQNYTLAAAAKSEYMWLIDIDKNIRDIHRMYGALLSGVDNADDFVALFTDKDKRQRGRDIITAAVSDTKIAEKLVKDFDKYCISKKHKTYLTNQRKRTNPDGKPVTWLADPDMFTYVKQLFAAKRVHPIVGNLAGTKAMAAIGAAATKLDTKIRIVYVSNAESFFELDEQARKNYKAMPHDATSVLVRTVMMGLPRAKGSVWHYQTHVYEDYVAKLDKKREYPGWKSMVSDLLGPQGKQFIDESGFSRITAELLPRKQQKKDGD